MSMLLGRAEIMAISRERFEEILRVATTPGRRGDADRLDAQRTLHRGLDHGRFALDRDLRIRLSEDLRQADSDEPSPTTSSNGRTNDHMHTLDILLSATPKLSDGDYVVPQPSLEEMVREHYRRIDVSGDGSILADRYLDRLRELAAAPSQTQTSAAPRECAAPHEPAGPTTASADAASDAPPSDTPGGAEPTPQRPAMAAILGATLDFARNIVDEIDPDQRARRDAEQKPRDGAEALFGIPVGRAAMPFLGLIGSMIAESQKRPGPKG